MSKAKARTVKDSRIVRILRAFDTAVASPHSMWLLMLSGLFSMGSSADCFDENDGWTPTTARMALISFALSVPEPVLAQLADRAEIERKNVLWFNRRGYLESFVISAEVKAEHMTIAQLRRAVATTNPEVLP